MQTLKGAETDDFSVLYMMYDKRAREFRAHEEKNAADLAERDANIADLERELSSSKQKLKSAQRT